MSLFTDFSCQLIVFMNYEIIFSRVVKEFFIKFSCSVLFLFIIWYP